MTTMHHSRTNEWIGQIPCGWHDVRLKDLFTYAKGLNITKADLVEDGVAVVSYGQIHAKQNTGVHIGSSLVRFVPEELTQGHLNSRLAKGDIVFADTSEDLEGIGNCVLNDSDKTVYAGYHALVAKARFPEYSKYLSYLFQTDAWRSQIRTRVCGIKVFSLTQRTLNGVTVILPPLPEQRRIAAYLDAKCADVDKAIAAKQRQVEMIETLWKNVLHDATLHGVGSRVPRDRAGRDGVPSPSENTTAGGGTPALPSGWKVKRLRYIGRCQNGLSKAGQYFGSGYPFVTYGDVYKNMALPSEASGLVESDSEERQRYSVQRGDIFFTRTSETADEVGFSSVCLKTIPNATFAGFVIRIRPVTNDLVPEFAQYYFRNSFVSQFFAKEMMVVTRASLAQNILKNLPVLLPPLSEQRRIAAYLDAKRAGFDALAGNLRRQVETLEQYRRSLIHECVTGKRRCA